MKKFLGENESFKEIYSMFTGLTRSKLLLAGIEMKVFNHLTEPKSADAVAEAIDAHPGNTRVILDGLTACDLVVKKNDLYYNAPAAQTFLVEGSPTFIGQTLTSWVQMGCASLNDIPKLVKEGPFRTMAFVFDRATILAGFPAGQQLQHDRVLAMECSCQGYQTAARDCLVPGTQYSILSLRSVRLNTLN